MGYAKQLDEYTDLELAQEVGRREKLRAAGMCDYCERPNTTSVCKHADRHLRDVVKKQ